MVPSGLTSRLQFKRESSFEAVTLIAYLSTAVYLFHDDGSTERKGFYVLKMRHNKSFEGMGLFCCVCGVAIAFSFPAMERNYLVVRHLYLKR